MITLKSIQLVGFKSFADKTVINLGEGVTCIVGPNGCGKSNVADSIRWVLGEQSAKMMRGSQMMDVIFGGTEKRRQMSFCEVTLTFDNTRRTFEIDADEVEMTRRLYRNGDSEYLLNRQPSRMKILTALLHGAGAAKEGYSIIGQGRIEQIMNARPEDRRSIFEEATGIVMFKSRKEETERKLAASRDKLLMFMQRMQEVERQLTPLKKSAENAIKYRDLYSELRRHEMNLYIVRTDGAEGQKSKLNAKIAEANEKIESLAKRSEDLLSEYHVCRDSLNTADERLDDLRERILRYSVSATEKTGEARLLHEKASSVAGKLATAKDDVTYSTVRIDEIEREIRRAEGYYEKNSQRLNAINGECKDFRENLDELSAKIADYEYMTGEHRKKVLDTFKDLSEISQNIGSLAAQKKLLEERLAEMDADMQKIRDKRDEAKTQYGDSIQKQSELEKLLGGGDALLEEAENKLSASENKLNQLIRDIYDAQSQITSLKDRLETYYGLRDRFEGYAYAVRNLMSAAKNDTQLSSKICGLIADAVSCSGEYEVAIETAFGGAMQNVICSTREDAQYLIEYLRRTRGGQATFLPIDAMRPHMENDQIKSAVKEKGALGFAIDLVKYDKKYENVIHHFLGNTLVVDSLDNARLISRRYPRAFRIVTLDGDQISVTGAMTGGSRREVAGNLLANERRIKELEEAVAAKKAFALRAEAKKPQVIEERDMSMAELNLLKDKLRDASVQLATVTEKQTSLLSTVTNAESEYAAYGQSRKALFDRLTELEGEYTGASASAGEMHQRSSDASDAINDMSAEYDKLVSTRSELSEKLNARLVEAASLESGLKSGKENVERLNREKESLIKKIAEIRAAIPKIERELDELNRQAERSALTPEEQAVVDDLRKQAEAVNKSKSELNERIKEIDNERLTCANDGEIWKGKLHSAEMQLQKIDTDIEYLKQRIEEEYGETYEGCLKYKEEGYDESQAGTAITQIKRQMAVLGPVNPAAVEEYEAVSERYEKMVIDRDDMEKGISDLSGVLNDIRDEMLNIFNEGFNLINDNFKHTFKELFGGGRAELQLDYTDCDDPLNAGVEIVACPPGKKLTKISLLSGGERALTAIAILFAIISMRPMPFCVLDEIEAALDEANVGRYAKYLKKFAQETQFIVITHRKPTMENADILFGVTMEEKGVSKIVSVKLSEVQERLGGDTVE